MASAWPTLSSTVELLSGLFSLEDSPTTLEPELGQCEPGTYVEELRRVIEKAESDGVDSEALDDLKQRLEEIEQEASKELTLTIRHAVSGEVIATVRARPSDTAAVLREGVFRETGDALVALRFILGARVLNDGETLEEAGIRDGDSVSLVRSPLKCLTASFDGTTRVCRLREGDAADDDAGIIAQTGPVVSAVLSPCGGFVLAVCSGGDGSVRCASTGELEFHLQGWVSSGEYSNDGQFIAGASDNGTARIWCAKTGRCLHVLSGHTDDVKAAAFSPDASLVATASCDGTASICEVASGNTLLRLAGHADVVRSVVFSQDGKWVLTTSMDATARVWCATSGECLQVLKGHAKALSGAQFSSDGLRVLTASFDGTVRVWDALSGECFLLLPAENNVVNAAAFSPDGTSVLVASASESLRLFCADTGECRLTLSGHEDWVRVASFSPDGMLVASGSYDGTARIWSALDGQCVQMLEGHDGAVVAATIVEA